MTKVNCTLVVWNIEKLALFCAIKLQNKVKVIG